MVGIFEVWLTNSEKRQRSFKYNSAFFLLNKQCFKQRENNLHGFFSVSPTIHWAPLISNETDLQNIVLLYHYRDAKARVKHFFYYESNSLNI